MKSVKIILEELKAQGIIVAEVLLEDVEKCFFHKILPKLILEADEAPAKLIASGLSLIAPAIEPSIKKAIDLNNDGHIGEV